MELRKIFSAIAVIASVMIIVGMQTGCKKDKSTTDDPVTDVDTTGNNEGTPTPSDTLPFVRCTINGTAFISDTVLITDQMGIRTFTAVDGNRRIVIATSQFAPGAYMLGSDDPAVAYQSGMTYFGPAFTNTGTLSISIADSHGVDGTFSANVQDIVTTGLTIFLPDGTFGNLPNP
jgi:hypothetical protein